MTVKTLLENLWSKPMIKLILLDIDGVMTDGRKYYDRDGTVRYKTFCDKDWTAIKRFSALNIKVVFLTGDSFNVSIAENRNIDVFVNRKDGKHKDKVDYLNTICNEYHVEPKEICYVGDDIFDVRIMNAVGYKYCPRDAVSEVKKIATILNKDGGDNVIAELFDILNKDYMIPKFDFEKHLDIVYKLDEKEKF